MPWGGGGRTYLCKHFEGATVLYYYTNLQVNDSVREQNHANSFHLGALPPYSLQVCACSIEVLQRFIEALQCFVKVLQRFIEALQCFVEVLQRFIEVLQRFIEVLQRFVEVLQCFVDVLQPGPLRGGRGGKVPQGLIAPNSSRCGGLIR